jgi:hypothetical protein
LRSSSSGGRRFNPGGGALAPGIATFPPSSFALLASGLFSRSKDQFIGVGASGLACEAFPTFNAAEFARF